jgi:CheY-like chemotaxis protein
VKVLIVDDSALARKVLRQALHCCGVSDQDLREAADGMQALAMLSREPAQLLFCDLHMPRVDGRALLSSLERSGTLASLHVVILSSEAHHLSPEERTRFGIQATVRKPVRPEAIQAIVATAVAGDYHG